MDKLNVGDYVRTKKGIKKIYEIDENKTKWKYLFKLKKQDGDGCVDLGYLCEEDIIKSAEGTPRGLLSLIEVGDIVNYGLVGGGMVLNKKEYSIDTWSILPNSLKNEDIKSVITKEQIEDNIYKVGE